MQIFSGESRYNNKNLKFCCLLGINIRVMDEKFYADIKVRKEILALTDNELNREAACFTQYAVERFRDYQNGNLSEDDMIKGFQADWQEVLELSLAARELTEDPMQLQKKFKELQTLFLYFTEEGLKRWPRDQRDDMAQEAIDRMDELW